MGEMAQPGGPRTTGEEDLEAVQVQHAKPWPPADSLEGGSQQAHYERVPDPSGTFLAVCCSCLGVVLYLVALGLVAHNEVTNACAQHDLGAAVAAHQDVDCSGSDAEGNIGQLVHFSCPVVESSTREWSPADFTNASSFSKAFRVRAAKVRQEVSMFQCKETHIVQAKEVLRSYRRMWSTSPINSSDFNAWKDAAEKPRMYRICGAGFHGNPPFPLMSQNRTADSLILGVFNATRHLGELAADVPVPVEDGSYSLPGVGDQAPELPFSVVNGTVLSTCPPGEPSMGCIRVTYFKSEELLSGLARLEERSGPLWATGPWTAPISSLCGDTRAMGHVDLVVPGELQTQELVWGTEAADEASTWRLRKAGVVLAAAGAFCFAFPFYLLSVLAPNFHRGVGVRGLAVPLEAMGELASSVGCSGVVLVSLGLGLPSALATMGLAACMVQPVPGTATLFAACGAAVALAVNALLGLVRRGRRKRGGKAQ